MIHSCIEMIYSWMVNVHRVSSKNIIGWLWMKQREKYWSWLMDHFGLIPEQNNIFLKSNILLIMEWRSPVWSQETWKKMQRLRINTSVGDVVHLKSVYSVGSLWSTYGVDVWDHWWMPKWIWFIVALRWSTAG